VTTATDAPVPLLDLRTETRALRPALDAAWARVVGSGQFILGPEVEAFEAEAAAYLGVRHAVGLNSGTDALTIALRALGVGAGDEVITTPFSFFATSETVLLLGATPVFVDLRRTVRARSGGRGRRRGPRTRAILPVHLFGELAPMAELARVARRGGLALIEDAAQAFGARYAPGCRACPTPGACSDALPRPVRRRAGRRRGVLVLPDEEPGGHGRRRPADDRRRRRGRAARRLRNHGSERRYHHLGARLQLAARRPPGGRVAGEAALARRLDGRAARRGGALRRPARRRRRRDAPAATPGHVYHQYTVRLPADRRDAVAERLREAGIATLVYYPETLERYGGRAVGDLPHAHLAAAEVLSLPIYPSLTEAAQDRVVRALRAAL
jgi:dTDP-4-amino-4,6-dideoxygalactose transaminase